MAGIRGGWLTPREAGIVLGVGRWTLRTLVAGGFVPTRRVKGRVYVSYDGLERLERLRRILRGRREGKKGARRK